MHPFANNWFKMKNNIDMEHCIVQISNSSFICIFPNIRQFQVKFLQLFLYFYLTQYFFLELTCCTVLCFAVWP